MGLGRDFGGVGDSGVGLPGKMDVLECSAVLPGQCWDFSRCFSADPCLAAAALSLQAGAELGSGSALSVWGWGQGHPSWGHPHQGWALIRCWKLPCEWFLFRRRE